MKILITVKTYPLPSQSHMELVCTAGVREDGTFVRLYPVDYRYMPYWQWYKKYQWIEVDVERNPKDPRPESYRPVPQAQIKPLGEPLLTKKNWAERKKIVLARPVPTMCALEATKQTEVSLGIVRPREVLGVDVEDSDRAWKPEWKALFQQQRLFGPQQKPLEKIPYKFSYRFKCEDPSCKGHKKMIEDWELGQLYRAMRDKFRDEKVAAEKVKHKFLNEICAPNVDTHFFVGTVLSHGAWVILGAFWPKKAQPSNPVEFDGSANCATGRCTIGGYTAGASGGRRNQRRFLRIGGGNLNGSENVLFARRLGQAEANRREAAMKEAIAEIDVARGTLKQPGPWSADIKATDEFLDILFDKFFEKIGLPNIMRKSDYHQLAALVPKDKIDPEVVEKLDNILSVAGQAKPRTD